MLAFGYGADYRSCSGESEGFSLRAEAAWSRRAGIVRRAARSGPSTRSLRDATGNENLSTGAAGKSSFSGPAARKPVAAKISLFRPVIRRRQMHAVLECLVTEDIGPGPLARKLTGELAAALGCRGGLALADQHAAVAAALHLVTEQAAHHGDPRFVLLSSLAPLSHVQAARAARLTPLLVDVDPDSGLLDRDSLQRLLAQRPLALMVCHFMAQPEPLMALRELGVPIVEDVTSVLPSLAPSGDAGRQDGGSGPADDGAALGSGASGAGRVGDAVVIGLQAPGALDTGGGGVVLARGRRGQRALVAYRRRCGYAELPDMNAVLALAQWRDLAADRRRCIELAARFHDAVARSRHRSLAPGAASGPLFPVLITDGMRAVQRYATRHRIETRLACEGAALTDVHPTDEVAGAVAGDRSAVVSAGEVRLSGARELARRGLLFPLYPDLGDGAANRIAKVLATLP